MAIKIPNMILEVKNLRAKANGKEILKGINFRIKKGEVQALLGPNGAGKSCFSQTILGNPKYKITGGKIFFQGREISKLSPEKRVELGIALAFQSAPAIKGVKLSDLLRKISKRKIEFKEGENILQREVNLDFSGGEKKISELLQVLSLNPKFVIFDEIDSGLDIKRLEKVAKIIKKELVERKVSILLITHWGQILSFLKPNLVNIILDGRIICRQKDYKKVLRTVKKYDYEKCKQHAIFSD